MVMNQVIGDGENRGLEWTLDGNALRCSDLPASRNIHRFTLITNNTIISSSFQPDLNAFDINIKHNYNTRSVSHDLVLDID